MSNALQIDWDNNGIFNISFSTEPHVPTPGWDGIGVRYFHATIWTPSQRRHWWQLWKPRERVLWAGPVKQIR